MNKENVSKAISLISEKHINEAAAFSVGAETTTEEQTLSKQARRHALRRRWAVAAACLAVIIAAGAATFVFAAEAAEYDTAMAFFDQYGLSPDGLSRAEIKAVYRDITTKKFSYGKTTEVIRQIVPGWEIPQAEPTAEEIAAVWDRNILNAASYQEEFKYQYLSYRKHDEQRDIEVLDKCTVKCSKDEDLLWTVEIRGFYVDGASHLAEGTVIWGFNETRSAQDIHYGWLAYVNDEGKVLWQKHLDNGFRFEQIVSVLNGADGTLAVVSRGDSVNLCLTRCDADGRILSSQKTAMGDMDYIRNAASLHDGYIVHLTDYSRHVSALLCRMDLKGNVVGTYSLDSEDCDYYITDMAEYNRQLYLSGYSVPKQSDEGGRHEIANVLDYIFAKENWEISSEELTALLRENYTAVLLLCDPENSVPKTFYSVKGSRGSKLQVNGSYELEWSVDSITSARFYPARSAYSISGPCKVFRYTFDSRGRLAGQTDTGTTSEYVR